jgi:hypothetical protein
MGGFHVAASYWSTFVNHATCQMPIGPPWTCTIAMWYEKLDVRLANSSCYLPSPCGVATSTLYDMYGCATFHPSSGVTWHHPFESVLRKIWRAIAFPYELCLRQLSCRLKSITALYAMKLVFRTFEMVKFWAFLDPPGSLVYPHDKSSWLVQECSSYTTYYIVVPMWKYKIKVKNMMIDKDWNR